MLLYLIAAYVEAVDTLAIEFGEVRASIASSAAGPILIHYAIEESKYLYACFSIATISFPVLI